MIDPTQAPLRQLRQAAGLSIREMALLTGINRGRLSILERGVSPTPAETARILAALQKRPETSER